MAPEAADGDAVRVLLVEDDADIRVDLADLLRDEGFEVVSACHGAEALSALRGGGRPDIILLDLMMPTMDGWTFRAQQLADASIASIPVLLLTAGTTLAIDSLLVAGCIEKPIKLERLFAEIRRLARRPDPVGDTSPPAMPAARGGRSDA